MKKYFNTKYDLQLLKVEYKFQMIDLLCMLKERLQMHWLLIDGQRIWQTITRELIPHWLFTYSNFQVRRIGATSYINV